MRKALLECGMDVTPIIDPLNAAQREAVTAPAGPVLVLAGAGSGKTRVLVHRIAWLIQVENVSPFGILAVTFTNKAAGEMRERIEQLLGQPAGSMWVGTFHGLAHRLLRQHWREAGLPQTFQILDSEDQYRLIRRMLKNLDLDESRYPPRQVQWFINSRKDEGLRTRHLPDSQDPYLHTMRRVYLAYEEACERGGVVGFADWLRGFGNLLIIDHGSGYLSLYSNNESLYKQVGDEVRAGDVIATVGSTGGQDVPGLYFELRHRGQPFDPLSWVR